MWGPWGHLRLLFSDCRVEKKEAKEAGAVPSQEKPWGRLRLFFSTTASKKRVEESGGPAE